MTYTWDNARGLVDIALTIAVAWVVSERRRRFPLVLIIGALAVQAGLVLALFAIPRSHTVLAAGSTMVAYAVLLAPVLPNAAGHVLAASIISAPAGILLARMIVPGDPGDGAEEGYVPDLKYDGAMDALACGIRDGVMMTVYVAAYLIVVVAFVWILNGVLALAPSVDGAPLTLQRIAGWVLAPIAYVIGVP